MLTRFNSCDKVVLTQLFQRRVNVKTQALHGDQMNVESGTQGYLREQMLSARLHMKKSRSNPFPNVIHTVMRGLEAAARSQLASAAHSVGWCGSAAGSGVAYGWTDVGPLPMVACFNW